MTSLRSRFRGCLILAVLSGWALAGLAQAPGTYEQITVGASVASIATTTLNPTGRGQMATCTIQAEQSMRWRADGTNPTKHVGTLMTVTTAPLVLRNAEARIFRMISTSTANAVVNVTCLP